MHNFSSNSFNILGSKHFHLWQWSFCIVLFSDNNVCTWPSKKLIRYKRNYFIEKQVDSASNKIRTSSRFTTKAQTSLRNRVVCSARLLFAIWKVKRLQFPHVQLIRENSISKLVSVAEQPDLSFTFSQAQTYKTFFMLNSIKHGIITAHKN